MSKALSVDLRARAVAAGHASATHREAAERFGVSAASVSRWQRLEREHGDGRSSPKADERAPSSSTLASSRTIVRCQRCCGQGAARLAITNTWMPDVRNVRRPCENLRFTLVLAWLRTATWQDRVACSFLSRRCAI
jgi:transposase-like protein